MSNNLARRGPYKVWSGYKTMRVPEEIFDDVKEFMERKKQIYLAKQEGRDIDANEILGDLKVGKKENLEEIIRQAMRKELKSIRGEVISGPVAEIPPAELTTKERVKQLLMQKPNEKLDTLQISKVLEIPNSTARQATREVAQEFDFITKIPGRPNKFVYEPDN